LVTSKGGFLHEDAEFGITEEKMMKKLI